MSTKVLTGRIKQRRGTESEWYNANPVLLEGELAISTDNNNRIKIGNGVSHWRDLSYSGLTVGNNITLDGHTISLTGSNVVSALGYTPPTQNTTYANATTNAAGLLPKLDGSTSKYLRSDGTWQTPPDNNTTYASLKNPNAITVKVYSGSSTPSNTTYDGSSTAAPEVAGNGAFTGVSASGKTVTFTKANGGTTAVTTQDTTYANAATNAAGLMSANDKAKLNGIATNANNYTLPAASTAAKGGVQLDGSTSKYLRGDGTWQTPPDNNTTYASLKNPNPITVKVYSGTSTSTDTSYDGSSTKSIEVASKDAIVGITRSGTTFTMTKADGSTDTFTQQDSNTTYANAATNAAGLMSAEDKVKLNGIAANANNYSLPDASTSTKGGIKLDGSTSKYLRGDGTWQTPPDNNTTYATRPNPNAMTYKVYSGTTASSDTSYDGSSTKSIEVASKDAIVGITRSGTTFTMTKADGTTDTFTQQDSNTTYANAATNAAGLMSAEDKVKLNGIAANANNYSLPDASTSAKGGIKLDGSTSKYLRGDGTWQTPPDNNTTYANVSTTGAGLAPKVTDTSKYLKGDGTWATPTNTTYANAATNAAGLMSAEDKVKLNGIDTNANNYTLPEASTTELGGIQLEGSSTKYLRADGTWNTPTNTTYASLKNPNPITVKVYSGTSTPADTTYDGSSTAAPEVAGKGAFTGVSVSGKTVTFTKADGGTTAITTQDNNTTYANVSTSAAGLAPKVTDTSKYLKGDGTWATPTNTTYADFTAASASANGSHGLVPAPTSGNQSKFLRGDATWATPTNTTYANAATNAAGLMSAGDKAKLNGIAANANNYSLPAASTSAKGGVQLDGSTNKYLRGDGTWQTPPDNNTTYANVSTSAAGLAPKVTDTSKYLKGDGTWATPTNTTYATRPNPNAMTYNVYSGTSEASSVSYDGSATQAIDVASKDAIVGITRSGTTFTMTKADGSTDTFTQQDSNTTYSLATITGTLAVGKGGTGATSFKSGAALIGNGTNAVTTRSIDTTNGGTASSTSLITSGAVKAGLDTKLNASLKGAANGLAELDAEGRVPASQLPSYVDDVIEGYLYSGKFYKESAHTTEISGETGKIYTDLSTNKTYRWSGTTFVEISASLAIGNTSSTAYRGDYGQIAYNHSQSAHAPSNAQANQNAFSNVVVGTTTVAADTTTDTLTLVAGGSVTLTPDASNDKITISAANTTYANVSTSAAGLAPKVTDTSKYLKGDGTWATPANTTYATRPNPNAMTYNVYSGTTEASSVSYDGSVTQAIDVASKDAIVGITRSGTTFTMTKADGTTDTFTQQDSNTTYANVSTSAAGLAPKVTDTSKYLKGDGTWATPANTTYASLKNPNAITVKVYSGTSTPANTTYDGSATAAPEVAGKGAFTGVSVSGKTVTFTKADGNTTAITTQDTNTTYADFTAASASANGSHGLVPAPTSGNQGKFLRGDATWATPTNTTYANATTSAAGLLPTLAGGTSKYLRADGTWQTPPDNNTTYASLKNPNAMTYKVYSGTSSSSDTSYDGSSTKSIEVAGKGAIVNITRSGTTFTMTKADGSTATFDQQDNNTTYGNVSTSAAGLAPKVTSTSGFLKGDGTWATPANTTYASLKNPNAITVKVYSGTSTSSNTTYDGSSTAAPEVAGKGAIVGITRSGTTFTMTKADGSTDTFTQQDSNTTYANVSTSAAGLAPKVTDTSKYLRGDGSWATPTNTTYANATTAAAGLLPTLAGGTAKYLRADGTWQTPPDNNTTYASLKNPNAMTVNVYSGSSSPTATTYDGSSTKSVSVAGSGAFTGVSRSGTTFTFTKADGTTTTVTQQDSNTTYANATTAAAGLMSADDKVKLNGIASGAKTGTVTSVGLSGSGGISISGSPITTSGTITVGVDGSSVINNLGEGTSAAQRDDYIVAQYAGGGTSTVSYHRRKLSNIFAAMNSSDVTTALGYTPPTTNTTYANATTSAAGLLPTLAGGTSKYLRADGTWQTPPDNNTTYASLKNPNAITLKVYSGTSTSSDTGYDGSSTKSVEVAGKGAFTGVSRSGTTFTFTKADGTTTTVTQQDNNTWTQFVGATTANAGTAGYLPAPGTANTGKYLRGDGTWNTPTNTTYANAATNAAGLMSADDKVKLNGIAANANNYSLPDASTSAKGGIKLDGSTSKYLRGDGTWQTPPDNNTTYASLKNPNAITVKVYSGTSTPANTTYDGSSTAAPEVAGKGAFTGVSRSGTTFTFTKADGSTTTVTQQDSNTTYANATTAAAGLLPTLAGGTSKYLRADGTWQTPPDNNTTYASLKNPNAMTVNVYSGSSSPTATTYDGSSTKSVSVAGSGAFTGVSRSGTTFTFTKADGTTTTVTQQDSNTTYAVVSTSTNGLAPTRDGSQLKYLSSDGTWAEPKNFIHATAVPTSSTSSRIGDIYLIQ